VAVLSQKVVQQGLVALGLPRSRCYYEDLYNIKDDEVSSSGSNNNMNSSIGKGI